MNSLRNLFYKKDVAEKFDANVNLLGFDNGVIDLKRMSFVKDVQKIMLLKLVDMKLV